MTIKIVGSLIDTPIPPTPMIIGDGILPKKGAMIMYGAPDAGKSMMTLHLAKCIATGTPWFGHPTKKSAVLIKQVEMSDEMVRDRLRDYEKGIGGRALTGFDQAAISSEICAIDNVAGLGAIKSEIQWIKERLFGLDVVVMFDPLYKMVVGNLNDQKDATRISNNLDELRRNLDAAIIVVHHSHKVRRAADGKAIYEGQDLSFGSVFVQAWPDTIMCLWRRKFKNSADWGNFVEFNKHKYAKYPIYPFNIRWDMETSVPVVVSNDVISVEELTIRDLEGEYCGTSEQDMADLFDDMAGSMGRD